MASPFSLRGQRKGTKRNTTRMLWPAAPLVDLLFKRVAHRLIPDPMHSTVRPAQLTLNSPPSRQGITGKYWSSSNYRANLKTILDKKEKYPCTHYLKSFLSFF